MNNNDAPRFLYGPGYQRLAARTAVEAGCKGNEMGVLYCLMTKIDWTTGQTPELAHTSLGEDMGGLGFNTIRACIRKLRAAGIITYAEYRGKGVVWSNGEGKANRYQMALPTITPVQKTTTPPVEKRTPPRSKNVHHNTSPYSSYGKKGSPSRRQPCQGDAASHSQAEQEALLLSKWTRLHGYTDASRMLDEWRQSQTVAAE